MIVELNKLGIALKSLDAMNIGAVGVNTVNLESYRTALKGLSVEQSVFALASKGATEEQIRQILVTDQAKLKDVEAAMAKAGLTAATKALNAEELITLATKKGISAERAKEIASALGLIATEEGQIVSKKQLTVSTLQQAGATEAEIATILGLNAAETTNIGITNLLTASFAKLWAVITAHPIGAILTAIGATAVGTIAYINKVNKDAEKAVKEAHENAETALNDTKTSLSDTKSELQSVNSELETTKSNLQDLASIGSPTLAEQNEINKLSTANAQLETQKSLLENNLKLKQKSAALDAKELLGTEVEMGYSDILDNSSITSHSETYTYVDHAKYEASNLKNAYNIYMKALRDGDTEKQKLAQDLIDSSSGDSAELTSTLMEIVKSFQYDDGTIIDGYEDLYDEYMGYIYNLQSLTNPDTFLEIAKSVTSGTNVDYEKAISDAYAMVYNGDFDINNLNKDFVDSLTNAGIDETTISYIFKKKQEEYQLVIDKINDKYNSDNVSSTYWDGKGNIHHNVDEEEQQKADIEKINAELNDYAKNNPIEFSLITSYDDNFAFLDKYIQEEKTKAKNNADYVGDYVSNAIKRVYTDAIDDAKNAASETDLTSSFDYKNLDGLESSLSSIQLAYNTATDALKEYNEQGYLSMSTMDNLLQLNDQSLNSLIDENGQLSLNSEALKNLTLMKLDEMKASTYQETASRMLEIQQYSTAEAANALALANGRLSQSAYDVAAEQYAKAAGMGGVYKQLADSAWDASQIRIGIINKQIEDVASGSFSLKKESDDRDSDKDKDDSLKTVDFIEERLNSLNDLISTTKTRLDNLDTTSEAKNGLADALKSVYKVQMRDLEAAEKAYQDKADTYLAKIPDAYKELAKNGGINITDFIGSGNDDLTEAISNYQTWADKVQSVQDNMLELEQTLKELEVDKFKNIADEYDKYTDIVSTNTDKINDVISLLEAQGNKVGKGIYEELISQTTKQMDLLSEERSKLQAQMNSALSNGIVMGSDEWNEMYSSLQDVDSSIIGCKNDIEDFKTSINDLHWDSLDNLSDAFSNINDELSNLIGLFENDMKTATKDGLGIEWSDEALAQIGLYAQQYEQSRYEASLYGDEINDLTEAYKNGGYSETEYSDKLAELNESQWDAVNSAESAKKALIDLNKTRIDEACDAIDKETDAFEELINKQKESLSAEKALNDYKKTVAEKEKSILQLRKKINAMLGSSDAATIAEREKLEADLADAITDLQDTQYDHNIETQQNALDKELEKYQKSQDDRKDVLEKSLDETDAILTDMFKTVKVKSEIVAAQIDDMAKKHGISISDSITSAWKSGSDAVAGYGENLTYQTSVFVGNLDNVKQNIYNTQLQANDMADSILKAFNVSGDTLDNTLGGCRNSLYATQVQAIYATDSISNLLSSYDTSGIIGSLDTVINKVNSLSDKLKENSDEWAIPKYSVYLDNDKVAGNFGSMQEAQNFIDSSLSNELGYGVARRAKILAFKKGGIVNSDKSDYLSTLAKSVGEDKMVAVKYGEGILKPLETQAFIKLGNLAPSMVNMFNNIKPTLPNIERKNQTPTISITYDNLVNIDGGTITKDSLVDMETIVKKAVDKTTATIAQALKTNGVAPNGCRPF